MKKKILLSLFTLCLLTLGTEITHANWEVIFKKIADTNTPQPGGSGNYTTFGVPSVDNNGNVVFYGDNGGVHGFQGIYMSVGGMLSIVVDEYTSIPGDPEFRDFMRFNGPWHTQSINKWRCCVLGATPSYPCSCRNL